MVIFDPPVLGTCTQRKQVYLCAPFPITKPADVASASRKLACVTGSGSVKRSGLPI